MTVVTQDNLEGVLAKIVAQKYLSLDTETTGLAPYKGHKLFSVIVGTKDDEYYFNFNEGVDHNGVEFPHLLPRMLLKALPTTNVTLFMANAKFDLHMLANEGIFFDCDIHDVLVMDRLIFNDHFKYSLEEVAKRNGYEKDDAVEEYIKEHGLLEKYRLPSGKEKKDKFYSKVPWGIIMPYGCRDARITFDIGMKQIETLNARPANSPRPAPLLIHHMEQEVTKVCFTMERGGAFINEELSKSKAVEHTKTYERAAREWQDITGTKLIDSAKSLAPVFERAGYILPITDKGNVSVTDDFLSSLKDSSLAKLVQTYREHYKIANTYYQNFLYYKGDDGAIHADMKQAGTRTGRFSYGDPNLQNVPDSEVRRAITPPPGYCMVSIDFEQQEYRVMLDYAKEMGVIESVLNGVDIHQATADMMGVERKPAKTLNFLLLYGGGVVKLCMALYLCKLGEPQMWAIYKKHFGMKMTGEERDVYMNIPADMVEEHLMLLRKARALRELYFEKLPAVKGFINRVISAAEARGYIQTWAGRMLQFPQKTYCYKAPNALIQGGCADIGKYAMIGVDRFLTGRKSRMTIAVHDELNLYMHESELHLVPEIKHIMENVFPHTVLPLTCSVSHSWENWYDLENGAPSGETTGKPIERKSST